jgi:hypothetical protein
MKQRIPVQVWGAGTRKLFPYLCRACRAQNDGAIGFLNFGDVSSIMSQPFRIQQNWSFIAFVSLTLISQISLLSHAFHGIENSTDLTVDCRL